MGYGYPVARAGGGVRQRPARELDRAGPPAARYARPRRAGFPWTTGRGVYAWQKPLRERLGVVAWWRQFGLTIGIAAHDFFRIVELVADPLV